MYSIGLVPKARYSGGMGGITPLDNADEFPWASFGWFSPRSVSLLARRNVPLSVLQNAGRCDRLWRDLALLLFDGERFGELPKDNSSFAGVSISSGTMGFFPLSQADRCLA